MKNVLLAYYSHAGHTARIARCIAETIEAEGHRCDVISMMEAVREGVNWDKYDIVIVGSPIVYGVYNRIVWEFASAFKDRLENLVKNSPWKPRDLKCIAGKVDYPNWNWFETLMIQIIMKITDGPTNPNTVADFTDYEDVRRYARHCLTLDEAQGFAKKA